MITVSVALIDLACRADYQRRTLPAGARCSVCGIDWVTVLFRRSFTVICYQCEQVARGLSDGSFTTSGEIPHPYRSLFRRTFTGCSRSGRRRPGGDGSSRARGRRSLAISPVSSS